MTGKRGMQLSFLSLLALLSACGGRVTDQGASVATEPGPHAGGAPGGGNAEGAAAVSNTGNAANGTNTGGSRSAGHESTGGSTSKGSGGATNGNGGTVNGSGGATGNDGGVTTGSGASLHAPTAQVWVGYIQVHVTTPDPPNDATPQHVVLALNPEGAEDVGSVILGDAAPPPPPTDPNAFYPPDPRGGGLLAANDYTGFLVEGVAYSLLDVRRTDTRLTFHLNPAEIYKDWCKLRTACSTTPAPETEYAPGPDDLCPAGLGFAVCSCENSRCRWSTADPFVWTLELELRGSFLEGQILQYEMSQGGLWARGVRLKRVE